MLLLRRIRTSRIVPLQSPDASSLLGRVAGRVRASAGSESALDRGAASVASEGKLEGVAAAGAAAVPAGASSARDRVPLAGGTVALAASVLAAGDRAGTSTGGRAVAAEAEPLAPNCTPRSTHRPMMSVLDSTRRAISCWPSLAVMRRSSGGTGMPAQGGCSSEPRSGSRDGAKQGGPMHAAARSMSCALDHPSSPFSSQTAP